MKTLKNIFLALVGTALIGEYLYQSHEPVGVILFVCAMWLGLVSTQSLNIEEFEEKEDFAIAGKEIKTVYTKLKNDLGRLYFELTKRKEIVNMKMIQYHVSDITRAKLLNKFDEFRNLEKEYIKNTRKALPTALEMGIPQAWMDFFNSVELVAECIKDYVDYDTFTAKERLYMRRFVTYATKYIKLIENEF